MEDIKRIGVIGAGTMGRGIAHIFVLHNYPVTLVDREGAILQRTMEKMRERTGPEEWKKLSSLLRQSTNMEEMGDCDLIIEAVFEDMEVKKGVFKGLSIVCKRDAILATNTSSFSINTLATLVDNPSRFIGMHFMNPPVVMKLVEVVRGGNTSEETVRLITGLAKVIEKIPVVVNDSPGFVSNRLLFALIGEAVRLLENGVARKEDIDAVMKYGMNHPMGPIELADFIGLDICHDIMLHLYESLQDDRYRPSYLIESLTREGKLGRKAGEGFYRYTR